MIDLGKDVPQAKILESAKEHHAEFIALSALMTTTMQRMREIVAAAKKKASPPRSSSAALSLRRNMRMRSVPTAIPRMRRMP